MRKKYRIVGCILFILILLSMIACASGERGKLNRVESPTESELRKNWKEYVVYYRGTGMVFKINDDNKIILDSRWVRVDTDEMMEKSKILQTWVREIRGQNDTMFGYLVQRDADIANVKIVDESTVQLFYQYVRTSGGP
jgi:hypothetical protein